jgi:hypothetical protein
MLFCKIGLVARRMGQQKRDTLLQDRVRRQVDGIGVAFGFQELIDLRLGKGGGARK